MMLDYRILGPGRVTHDSLIIDPSVPLADQAENLTEDLLQVEYENCVVLDVGWYADLSPDGRFRVFVVLDLDWEEPWFSRTCTEYPELITLISAGAKVAEWLGRVDDRLALTLHADGTSGPCSPTWGLVLHALLAMDGQEKTLTCLELPNGTTLMVGGGNDGRYLVSILVDPETQESHVLTDPTATGPNAELCCGGQTAAYPAPWCVDLRLVLDAARHFISHGGMAPELTWE